jgi:hypothetical protein
MRPAYFASMALVVALAPVGCKRRMDREPDPGATSASRLAPAGHLRVTDEVSRQEVAMVVRVALAGAVAEKRRLVVYVGAEWCEPCTRFRRAAASGALDATFGEVTLLAFDWERDGARLTAAGYASHYIPLFALPAQDGTSSQKRIEGGIKGAHAVDEIVPRLRALIAL